MWQRIKTTYTETSLKVLGRRKKKFKSWISTESWRKIKEKRKLKKKIGDARSERLKNTARKRLHRKGQGGEEEPQEGHKRLDKWCRTISKGRRESGPNERGI